MASWLDDYKSRVSQDVQQQAYHERRQSQAAQFASSTEHLYTIRSSVTIPLLQSLIMGIGVGAAAGILVSVFDIEVPAWVIFGVVTAIIALITWIWLLRKWSRIVGLLERLVKQDINQDGFIGYAPEEEPEDEEPGQKMIHVELISEDGRRGQFFDMPDYPWMQLFARKILNGTPLSFSEWTGQGKPFTRGEFEQLQDLLIEQDLAVWRDKTNRRGGMVLKLSGREVFKKLADDNYSPTLPD